MRDEDLGKHPAGAFVSCAAKLGTEMAGVGPSADRLLVGPELLKAA